MSRVKKIIIIIASVICALLLLGIILTFTVFTFKKFDIEFETTTNLDSDLVYEQLTNEIDFDFNKALILLDKHKIVNQIENKFPYLKVINMEIKFPNSITIHMAQRQELYAFIKNDNYYIVDEDMKVLRIEQSYVSNRENAILVKDITPSQNVEDIQLSSVLEFEGIDKFLFKQVYNAFLTNNRNKVEMMGFFKELTLFNRVNPESYVNELTLKLIAHDGFEYYIYNKENNTNLKVNKLFACDVTTYQMDRLQYKMIIYQNSSGVINVQLVELV